MTDVAPSSESDCFRAGLAAPCEHGIRPKRDCPDCRLRPEEIARLLILLSPAIARRPAA